MGSASAAPSVVPAPWSNPAGVDPEEAYVASISSCHMLTFLFVAARAGFAVASYRDEAVGIMTRTPGGAAWISRVTSCLVASPVMPRPTAPTVRNDPSVPETTRALTDVWRRATVTPCGDWAYKPIDDAA